MYWVSLLENRRFGDLNPRLYGHEDCTPGQSFGPVVRDHWMLYYVDRGKGRFFSDGEAYDLHGRQLFIIHPDASTRIVADETDPWFFHWIGFDGAMGDKLRGLPLVLDFTTDVFDRMDQVEDYPGVKEEFLISQLLLLYCRLFACQRDSGHVEKVKALIHGEYMRKLTIEEIAFRLSLDRRYLARLFKRETGRTMQQYLIKVRARHARELLEKGYGVSQVMEMVGYDDMSSFSRMFKRQYGFSPSSVKKAARI